MSKKDEILSEAMRLSSADRAELASKLIRTLDDEDVPGPEAADAWDVEIEKRAQEVVDGTVKTVPWKTVQARLARLRRTR